MIYNRMRAVAVAGTAAAVLGTGMAVAAPAAVADPCPAGALCAYVQKNYAGDPGTVYGDNGNLLQYPEFDHAKSVFNNGRYCGVTIFTGLNHTGWQVHLRRGYGYTDLETQNPGFFRNVASNQWSC